jgi:hypothetical protein
VASNDAIRRVAIVESAPTEVEIENQLHSEILSLWITHRVGKAVARKSNEELRTLRLDLGKKLYEMKSILARNGRGGGWTPYLRVNGFARATADRLAHMHETSLEPETKCLAEAIPETTAEDVRRLGFRREPGHSRGRRTRSRPDRFKRWLSSSGKDHLA